MDVLRQFIAESEELTEALRSDIESLSRHAGALDPALVNRAFRSAHSLKGVAGMAGVESVSRAAHRLEDVLDDVRMGRVSADRRILDVCGAVAEDLAEMVAEVARGGAAESIERRIEAAVALLSASPSRASDEDELGALDLDDRVRATLTEYEEHRLRENVRARRPIYQISVAFDIRSFDSGFRSLSERLSSIGEVISTLPGAAPSDPLSIAFRLVVATEIPLEDLELLVAAAGGTLACISRYSVAPSLRLDHPAPVQGATVRVEIHAIEALAVQAESLALKASDLAATCDALAERLNLGQRERFEIRQRARSIRRGFADLESGLVDARLVPLAAIFARSRRRAQRVAAELGREVECVSEGDEMRLDKAIVDRLADPIAHLLNNAIDHGIEASTERVAAGKPPRGRILIRAEPRGNRIAITVRDDGRGVDSVALEAAAKRLGFHGTASSAAFIPGVTTAREVSAVSGRGVGLDVVASTMAAIGGEVDLSSEAGGGTTCTLTVPTTLVLASVFLVAAAGAVYAIDVNQILEIGVVESNDAAGSGAGMLEWRGSALPFVRLASLVGRGSDRPRGVAAEKCVVVRLAERPTLVGVDGFEGEREALVKSLGRYASTISGVIGAIELEGNRVALLLDLTALASSRHAHSGGA